MGSVVVLGQCKYRFYQMAIQTLALFHFGPPSSPSFFFSCMPHLERFLEKANSPDVQVAAAKLIVAGMAMFPGYDSTYSRLAAALSKVSIPNGKHIS